MKCFRHSAADALGVCSYCGRALCQDCAPTSPADRLTCSGHCAAALRNNEQALLVLLDKSVQSARASAFYCYLTSALSAGAAVAAWFMLPAPFLIYFTGACAVALAVSGIWHGRVARRRNFAPLRAVPHNRA